jgi:hypothetical protein
MQATPGLRTLYVVHDLANDTSFHAEPPIQPIYVVPFQGQRFADPKTETDAQDSYGAERLLQGANKFLEFFHR